MGAPTAVRSSRRATLPIAAAIALATAGWAQAQIWQRIGPATARPCALATSAAEPRVLWAGMTKGGVFRIDDTGRQWRFAGSGLGWNSACSVVVDEDQASRAWVLSWEKVFETTDRGATWARVSRLPLGGQALLFEAIPRGAGLYAATTTGFYSTVDARRWRNRSPPGARPFVAAAFDAAAPQTVFGATRDSVYRSRNGGRSWSRLSMPARTSSISSLATLEGQLFVATGRTLLRSSDDGDHWRQSRAFGPPGILELAADRRTGLLYVLARVPVTTQTTLHVTADGGDSWFSPEPFARFGKLYSTAAGVYASTDIGLLRSVDGRRWERIAGGLPGSSMGAVARRSALSPSLFAAAPNGALWRRPARGAWQNVTPDPGPDLSYTTGALTFLADPQPTVVAGARNAVYTSTDDGVTWERHTIGTADDACMVVRALHVVGGEPALLYARAVEELDCFGHQDPCTTAVSEDGGRTWSCLGRLRENTPLVGVDPFTGALFSRREGVVARSTDRGASWRTVEGNVHSLGLLTFHPSGLAFALGGTSVLRSDDGGATWRPIPGPPVRRVADIVADPQREETVYVASPYDGVFVSRDGGASWQPAGAGLGPEVTVTDLELDGSTLYAATEGGGVLRLLLPN